MKVVVGQYHASSGLVLPSRVVLKVERRLVRSATTRRESRAERVAMMEPLPWPACGHALAVGLVVKTPSQTGGEGNNEERSGEERRVGEGRREREEGRRGEVLRRRSGR